MTGYIEQLPARAVHVPSRITIDKGIPLPPKKLPPRSGHYGNYVRYPWRDLEQGDSFAIPIVGDSMRLQAKVRGVMTNWTRQRPGNRYASRVLVENGVDVIRVWRVA